MPMRDGTKTRRHNKTPHKSCVAADQDGTLYPTSERLFSLLRDRTKAWLAQRLKCSEKEIATLYSRLQREQPNPLLGFMSVGASPAEYHANVFDPELPRNMLQRDNRLIRALERISRPLLVVTFAPLAYSEAVHKALGVHHLVGRTYCAADYPPSFDKAVCYQQIRRDFNMQYSDIYVVGDNFETDVTPGMVLGCKAIHVSSASRSGGHITIRNIHELPQAIDRLSDATCTMTMLRDAPK